MTDVLESETNLIEIKNKYEALIQKIFAELQEQKEEQSKIKQQILDIIEENSRASSKTNISHVANDSNGDREHGQLTSDAISNLKQQVDKLKEERKTIKQLWNTSQETIANLETEIQSYRNQLFKPNSFSEIKQRYCSAIKSLELIIENQKKEISTQSWTIRDLIEEKNKSNDRVKEYQKILNDQEKMLLESKNVEKSNSDLKQQLQAVLRTNSELETSSNIARNMIDERFIREKKALEKLQEALLIAETAMTEKENALKRELIIKEECETLAKTIGQVMEEAARKVEKDVDCLKAHYEKKQKFLLKKYQDSLAEVDLQVKATRASEARCFALEQKLRDVIDENNRLDRDLQIASQTIVEMELQLNATEKLLNADKNMHRNNEDQEEKLRYYIESNHNLKERWKSAIEDMTSKFGMEIQRLQNENAHLKAKIENERQNGYKLLS